MPDILNGLPRDAEFASDLTLCLGRLVDRGRVVLGDFSSLEFSANVLRHFSWLEFCRTQPADGDLVDTDLLGDLALAR